MHSGILRGVFVACLLMMASGPVTARELLAVGTSFPGVFERTAAGEYRGLAPSVLTVAFASLGHTVRFAFYPWARAQRMVERGQADILIGPYKSPAREARFAFAAEAFYRDPIVFYRRVDSRVRWSGDYRQLAGLPIGIVRAWAYGSRFDDAHGQLDLVTVESVENGLRMLDMGRLALLASNQRNTLPVLAELGLNDEIVQLEPLIDVQDGYFAFPPQESHRPLREAFDQVFRQMVAQGQLAVLAAHWRVDIPQAARRP